MIAPHMATMLSFVTTDAAVPPSVLQESLRQAADGTFNRVTVDGDTSTNDSLIVLASGRSGAEVSADGAGTAEFQEALHAVTAALSLQMVKDGEGATKLIEAAVSGAANGNDAEKVARAVAESQLVKCAVYGGDPNWGRIVCAIGYSGAQVAAECTTVDIGEVRVFEKGVPTGRNAAGQMQADRICIRVDLGIGSACATIWTCDLTEDYVRINAEYHT